jgi:hypothetical protein
VLAGLFHHFVTHHSVFPVLASLGCGCPALGDFELFKTKSLGRVDIVAVLGVLACFSLML